MIQVLWLCFYFNSIGAMYVLYEKMYLSNLFNVRYKEQNNDTQILNPFYRIVNLVKSVGLMLFTLPAFYIMQNYEAHENNIDYIHFLAALYSALDFSAMCFNTTSHISTKVHHILVQLLYYYGVYQNWNQNSIAHLIFIYACYSSSSYLVNGRLAIRNSHVSEEIEYMVNDLSLVIYIWSALSNWITQLYYLMFYTFYDHIAIKIIYILIVSMIIYDDVFLMKYLYKNTKYIPKQEDIEEFKNKLTYISENNPLILYKNENE